MSKKIISVLIVATILFMCVFAACGKESLYASDDDYQFVTDANGEKVLDEDGQLLVYVTNEKGKYVTEKNGEKATQGQQFVPLKNDNVVEDYGFKITLPEGWDVNETKVNSFSNKDKKMECDITIVRYFYDDYYNLNKQTFETIEKQGVTVTWEDNIDLGDSFKNACRFTMSKDGAKSVLYFFENSGNVYKILFTGEDVTEEVMTLSTVEFCKAIQFKNFTYYNDVTAVSTTEAAE